MTEEEHDLWTILDSVNQWIRFADAKAGATLAISGAVASLVALDAIGSPDHAAIFAATVASLVAALGALVFALLALAPILETEDPKETTVFFGHIAKFDTADACLKAFRSSREGETLATEAAHQIRENARVATYKFSKVRTATQFAAGQIVLAVAVLFIHVGQAI